MKQSHHRLKTMYGYHVPRLEERHGRKFRFEMYRLVNYISFVAGAVVFLVGLFGILEQCSGISAHTPNSKNAYNSSISIWYWNISPL